MKKTSSVMPINKHRILIQHFFFYFRNKIFKMFISIEAFLLATLNLVSLYRQLQKGDGEIEVGSEVQYLWRSWIYFGTVDSIVVYRSDLILIKNFVRI